MIIIYHASCADGFCAAWLLHKVYPDAEFMPYRYSMPAPDVTGHDVIIADFSFPLVEMQEMIQAAKSLICFDHHQGVPQEVRDLPGFVFDNNKSGARLVWEHYFAKGFDRSPGEFGGAFTRNQLDHFEGLGITPDPWLVRYTEDRDLWRFELKFSREINAGLALEPFDFRVWDGLSLNSTLESGRVMWRYFNARAERAAHNAKYVMVKAIGKLFRVPCVNVANPNEVSLTGEVLALRDDADFGMTYFFDGTHFVFSVRSRDDFDVSEVARFFGGNGHKNAAGFRLRSMFDLIVSS